MNSFTFLSTAGSIALSGGIFLVAYPCLLTCIELLVRIWHKIFATWAERRLRQMGILRSKPYQAQVELDWKRLGVLIAIPFLASAVHDLLLSPLVLLIGTTILIWMNVRNRQVEQAQVDEDAETVALQIRSLLSIDHSMINALCQVKLPPGRMRQAIEQISSRLRLQQSPEQAVHSFTNLPGVVTARLSALIAQSSRLTDQVQDELLATLEQEAHRQKLLRSKTHQTLSLVRGTIRLLQGVVAGAAGFVMFVPAWRNFFLQDVSHQVLLAVLICAAVLASLYFEYEVHQLAYGTRA